VFLVNNCGHKKHGRWDLIENELVLMMKTCRSHGVLVKVIIETPLLTRNEKIRCCRIIEKAEADFVKTCTGTSGEASLEDVALLKKTVSGSGVRIKAAGGIRTYSQAQAMIAAGADRIGTSSGIQIVREELKHRGTG
jgi:deoxyribose-phosphate aldolase